MNTDPHQAKAAAQAIELFAGLGVTIDQLANKIGRQPGYWSGLDIQRLGNIHHNIRHGYTTITLEFHPRLADWGDFGDGHQ